VLGGTTGAAHGDANSVMLPYVMRFNLEVTASQLAPAAEAIGLEAAAEQRDALAAAEAVVGQVAEWVAQMALPARLREIGVAQTQVPTLAALAFGSPTVRNNPKPIAEAAEIEALLRAAW